MNILIVINNNIVDDSTIFCYFFTLNVEINILIGIRNNIVDK